jgi:hypothetical protein
VLSRVYARNNVKARAFNVISAIAFDYLAHPAASIKSLLRMALTKPKQQTGVLYFRTRFLALGPLLPAVKQVLLIGRADSAARF